jgi:hypothetical protein
MLILLTFLFFVYIYFGSLALIQIILWMIVFLLSNFFIGINPLSRELYIIRIMAFCVIIFILYYNSMNSSILTAFILPLSISKISYFNELGSDNIIYVDPNFETERFYLFKVNETSDFLNKLDINDNYIAIIEFIPEISEYEIDAPQLFLSKPFLINKFSSETTLTKFMFERLNYMVDYYYLDDSIIQQCKDKTGPVIVITYSKFYLL